MLDALSARKYLANVPMQNYFVLPNGKQIENLEGLYSAISSSDDPVFYHHVTADRNDFASWIKACIMYDDLAARLADIKQKEVFLGVLAEEIAALKGAIAQPISQPTSQQSISQPMPQPISQQISQPVSQPVSQVVPQPSIAQPPSSPPVQATPATQQAAPSPQPQQPPTQDKTEPAPPMPESVKKQVEAFVELSKPPAAEKPPLAEKPVIIEKPPVIETPAVQVAVAPSVESVQPSAPPTPVQEAASVQEEIYEFEEILKSIIEEIEKEIISWEA